MKKFAIIGTGFSGLAVACHLLHHGVRNIHLFDKKGVGGGASGIAAGLLHPYAGAHAKKNPHADEGMNSTINLLNIIEEEMDESCSQRKGILRVALTSDQEADYRFCSEKYEDVSWIQDVSELVPGTPPLPGILIHSGISINCKQYLQGLWKYCERHGVQFFSSEVHQLQNLPYDHIIVTGGMETLKFAELAHLKLRPVKGQILRISWPKNLTPLPLPLNSQAYLVMDPSKESVWAGATFERHFKTESIDLVEALSILLPKVEALYPPLKREKILECHAALRASTPDHQPLWGKIDDRISYLTGLGSKGLLYHSLFAKQLADLLK